MATPVEDARGLIAAAHQLLVRADQILDDVSAAKPAVAPDTADVGPPEACEHPPAKREDISGFGEPPGARYRCGVCREEVKAA